MPHAKHRKGEDPSPKLAEEEETDAENGDDGTKDGAPRDLLTEQPVGGENDDDRGQRHQRGGDASTRVLNGHEREADTDEGAEDGSGRGYNHALAVAEGVTQRMQALTEIEQEREADDTGYATQEIGTEGDEPFGHSAWLVVVHTHLAEHQADALTESRPDGIEHTIGRQLQRDLMMLATTQHGDADTNEGDEHGYDAHERHVLSQSDPCHQGRRQWGQSHEQLTIA